MGLRDFSRQLLGWRGRAASDNVPLTAPLRQPSSRSGSDFVSPPCIGRRAPQGSAGLAEGRPPRPAAAVAPLAVARGSPTPGGLTSVQQSPMYPAKFKHLQITRRELRGFEEEMGRCSSEAWRGGAGCGAAGPRGRGGAAPRWDVPTATVGPPAPGRHGLLLGLTGPPRRAATAAWRGVA